MHEISNLLTAYTFCNACDRDLICFPVDQEYEFNNDNLMWLIDWFRVWNAAHGVCVPVRHHREPRLQGEGRESQGFRPKHEKVRSASHCFPIEKAGRQDFLHMIARPRIYKIGKQCEAHGKSSFVDSVLTVSASGFNLYMC